MKRPLLTFLVPLLFACSSSTATPATNGGAADVGPNGTDGGVADDAGVVGDDSAVVANDGGAGGDGAASGDASAFFPLPNVSSAGGPIVKNPVIVPVVFTNDEVLADLDTMLAAAAKSTYWADQVVEYGVGKPTFAPTIKVTTAPAATLSDADVANWLTSMLDGTHPEFPAPSDDTFFVLIYPQGTTIDIEGAYALGPSCKQWHGVHENVTVKNAHVPFAIISRCPSIPEVPGLSGAKYVAAVMSHEVLEGLADPQNYDNPAYYVVDPDHLAWEMGTGGEIGDMCALEGNAFYQPADFPYTVQKMWSNKAAAAGKDPCQPEKSGETFFLAQPELPDVVTLSYGAGRAVKIPVGESRTIPIHVYADGPLSGPIKVDAREWTSKPGQLSFTLDQTQVKAGDAVNVTIKAEKASAGGEELFVVLATVGTRRQIAFGVVSH